MMRNILLFGIWLTLSFPFQTSSKNSSYIIMSLDVLLLFLIYLATPIRAKGSRIYQSTYQQSNSKNRLLVSLLMNMWIPIVLSWVWGVIIGLINNVNPTYIFRNFFGLLMYLLFPILWLIRPKIKEIIVVIFFAGIIQAAYGIYASIQIFRQPLFIGSIKSISELRTYYSTSFIVIFPLCAVALANYFIPKKFLPINESKTVALLSRNILFLFLMLYAAIIPAMSKGMMLTTFLLILFVLFISFLIFMKTKSAKNQFTLLLMTIPFILLSLPQPLVSKIVYTFSNKEISNSIRNIQADYLIREFTFFGKGLGAPLRSGYSRDITGYGFELTYLNIIHKLGIFSIFLFLSYIMTIMIALSRIVKKINLFRSFFAVGLMGYTIVGAGNPILLSPIAVILHCIAIYILVYPNNDTSSRNAISKIRT